MGRLVMVKPRENRVPIMMSDKELEDVDDWRFSNRVATRSDAIRRLCQIAIDVEVPLANAADYSEPAMRLAESHLLKIREKVMSLKDGPQDNAELLMYRDLLGEAYELSEMTERAHLLIVSVLNRIVPLIDSKTFKQAVKRSEQVTKEFAPIFARIRKRDRQTAENIVISHVLENETAEERAAYEALTDSEKDQWWERKMIEELGPPEDEEDEE